MRKKSLWSWRIDFQPIFTNYLRKTAVALATKYCEVRPGTHELLNQSGYHPEILY
jgi:hypothetical protein